jgi:tetratricopeptide (TPR) repeat protein
LREKGALEEAAAAHKKALRLQPNTAVFHNNAAGAYLALDALDEAVAASKEAIRLEPDAAGFHTNLAFALLKKGALDEAEEVLHRAAALLEKQNDPPRRATNLILLAEVHRDTARSQEADEELRQALAILEKETGRPSKDRDCVSRLAWALSVRAQLCRDRDDLAEARRLFGEAVNHQKKVLELGGKTSPFDQGHVSVYSLQLADTLLHLPQDPGLTQQAETLLQEAVQCSAKDRSARNALAWFLATCRQPRFRDCKRAVELAERLVEQGPQRGTYWRTLGAARYGIGDWRGAIAALEKAMQLSNGGDGTERFFLAMASWRMGKPEDARTSYERAVQWMEKHKPQHYELCGIRAEAAALLGISEQPANKQPTISKQHSTEKGSPPQSSN